MVICVAASIFERSDLLYDDCLIQGAECWYISPKSLGAGGTCKAHENKWGRCPIPPTHVTPPGYHEFFGVEEAFLVAMDEESLTGFSLDGGTETSMLKILSQIIKVTEVAGPQGVMHYLDHRTRGLCGVIVAEHSQATVNWSLNGAYAIAGYAWTHYSSQTF